MAVAFRSLQSVTNATAGTSVTVSKPSGIVDTGTNSGRDILVAFIAATGAPTFTPPASWTLITTAVDAGNNVTLRAYWKLASSEGASWTWTLGSSQRNWGWVGAYTGVDPTSPIVGSNTDITLTTSTTLSPDSTTTLPNAGRGIGAGAAVRTASGSATTWTTTSTERSDLSTNAGAGTDISGVIGDSGNSTGLSASYLPTLTASQSQAAGALIALTLTPYFVPFGARVRDAGIVLEAAFGVDPDGDSSTWTWTDLTAFVHQPGKIVLDHGRANRSSVADPSRMGFTLLNLNGEFTNPAGTYARSMVQNLPFRVRLNGFGVDVGGKGYHRGTAFMASMRPRWDYSLNFSVVDIVAQGRLRRLQQGDDVLKSAAYTAIQRMASNSGYTGPLVHWPFEDESGATKAASAVSGVDALTVTDVEFAADTSIVGAAPLAKLTATSVINGPVPFYADTGTWTAMWCMTIPAEPLAETVLMDIVTSGTANRYRVTLLPGSPSQLVVKVFAPSAAELFNSGTTIDETLFFGAGHFYTFTATQNGADVDFAASWYGPAAGGKSGTVSTQTLGVAQNLLVALGFGADDYGFGQLALHTAPGATGSSSSTAIVDANAGDWPWARFQRLATEQNVPYIMDQSDNTDLEMGPQTVASFVSLVREAELVEGCVVNDSGEFAGETGLLWFPARDDRENIDASMMMDMSAGQVVSIEPILDDQDIVNDFEASRSGGSSARVRDEVSIAKQGRYRQGETFNVEDDRFLANLAGWRVNLGTQPGMRFPSVSWNLRRSPELAEAWVATRLFNRVDITNPPAQYPPDDIQAILEGYTETLSSEEWTVKANLSSYQPNKVFLLADTTADAGEYVGRLTGDPNCALRTTINDSALSLDFDPNPTRWTTTSDDFNPNLEVRLGGAIGEVVTVSSISTTAVTVVGAGTDSHADNAAVSPNLYGSNLANDLICVLGRIRGTAGSLATPTGYTLMKQVGNLYWWAKVHSGTESAPTVTPSGGSSGDTVSAITFGLRGTSCTLDDLTDMIVEPTLTQSNASAGDIAYGGVYPKQVPGCIVLLLAGKSDDWTSAVASGWTELAEPTTTTGSDQSMYIAYKIQTTPAVSAEGTIAVTGGASAVSESMVVALAAGYQTMTISARSVNGAVASHAAGTTIEVEDAFALGM